MIRYISFIPVALIVCIKISVWFMISACNNCNTCNLLCRIMPSIHRDLIDCVYVGGGVFIDRYTCRSEYFIPSLKCH